MDRRECQCADREFGEQVDHRHRKVQRTRLREPYWIGHDRRIN
jgi:hypothetical protein